MLRLVMHMVGAGTALCVPGNHDMKLMRKLNGKDVRITHGLAETLAQLEHEPAEFADAVRRFVDGLVSHLVLDEGRLVVAHAGMKESMQGRGSAAVREFALYGESTGETDEYGLPVRYDWARDYRGKAMVIYGHTPVPQAEWVNRTLCIDTGCVFGGELTALRYPERELVSVPAQKVWYEPVRPLAAEPAAPQRELTLLDYDDVGGKRVVNTRIFHKVTVREENAAAALEVMSRFAVDPRWLVYLPPTMAPPEAAPDGDSLERPEEVFAYYRHEGVGHVVCQEKHMGSRAVIVLCRDESVARRRFGIGGDGRGVIYTRSGRRFFEDGTLEQALLDRIDTAMDRSGLWDALQTDWIVLDAELMPWSAKAQELLRAQYAPTGIAGCAALSVADTLLAEAGRRLPEIDALHTSVRERRDAVERYVTAYRRYCWTVNGIDDLRLAPFHILATENSVGLARDHRWQMETLATLCATDPGLLNVTQHRFVDLADPASVDAAAQWWLALTAAGGEGMVVKPVDAIARGRRGLVQPALKCRGREYLRIIYGPEYTDPKQLERLRHRRVAAKRSLAIREFALGIEALHRFTEAEPLYRVHECVFSVLALESEPVDARL
ncbi:polynucleotide kinase-phosphatase [Tahibacter amnicola]|uniref:Polynucleotide kinase-phosphatase n=1 Tax=Tahibacter amnicola TaxID=2976241 RepID=A0ABY6BFS9_9GAMM|nr:polynucleotide kinase-phosphatase [Tahibacter amnicola]UXI68128.1 polynucleotide kinase-phosphatase [Tahibacter amnicola]